MRKIRHAGQTLLVLVTTTSLIPGHVRAQTVGGSPAFEVASVKPSAPGSKTQIRRDPAGGFTGVGVPLKTLILLAYNIQEFQLVGLPGSMASDRYDIVAKAPSGAKKEQTWPMLQTLLSGRFRLALHKEERQLTVYALVVSKKGFKLQESTQPPSEADDSVKFGSGRMSCIKVPMADLALALSSVAGRRVIDRTGIVGKFDLTLIWSPRMTAGPGAGAEGDAQAGPRAAPESDEPSLFGALEEQVGLKLSPEKGAVDVFVVDQVEKASSN